MSFEIEIELPFPQFYDLFASQQKVRTPRAQR
jgi:hypothetical protein